MSELVITFPPPVYGQSPIRRGYYPNILGASYNPVSITFPDFARGIRSYWRLISAGFFFLNSATVANRSYGIEPLFINEDPAGDGALGGFSVATTSAGQWGKLTYSRQGDLSTNGALLNHNVGALAQLRGDMTFSGADKLKFWNYNPQAGDYMNIHVTFEFLNFKHRIFRPG